ncbi:hypothetical protein AMECASPLE_013012 [Ameca splendens]|uniref:Secreted protein n=1 Tax=Ameca splendens TaxID=208324 RepID=A0ABV0YZA8_9TELE
MTPFSLRCIPFPILLKVTLGAVEWTIQLFGNLLMEIPVDAPETWRGGQLELPMTAAVMGKPPIWTPTFNLHNTHKNHPSLCNTHWCHYSSQQSSRRCICLELLAARIHLCSH